LGKQATTSGKAEKPLKVRGFPETSFVLALGQQKKPPLNEG
jgi:hypothetical protein